MRCGGRRFWIQKSFVVADPVGVSTPPASLTFMISNGIIAEELACRTHRLDLANQDE